MWVGSCSPLLGCALLPRGSRPPGLKSVPERRRCVAPRGPSDLTACRRPPDSGQRQTDTREMVARNGVFAAEPASQPDFQGPGRPRHTLLHGSAASPHGRGSSASANGAVTPVLAPSLHRRCPEFADVRSVLVYNRASLVWRPAKILSRGTRRRETSPSETAQRHRGLGTEADREPERRRSGGSVRPDRQGARPVGTREIPAASAVGLSLASAAFGGMRQGV